MQIIDDMKSVLFISVFYTLTAFACILCMPILLIPNNKVILWSARTYDKAIAAAERAILGLSYEVRGEIPKGKVIIAAKHFSAYETFKLHLLFENPAIVLKSDLLKIPIWGWFLARAGAIPIDRAKKANALYKIGNAAKEASENNRPIIIFPQGTRVSIHDTPKDKPYQAGVVRMQTITGAPIVPLATNSGAHWPRNTWRKKGGVVVFEFLEAIPLGLNRHEILSTLSNKLETASNKLVELSLIS